MSELKCPYCQGPVAISYEPSHAYGGDYWIANCAQACQGEGGEICGVSEEEARGSYRSFAGSVKSKPSGKWTTQPPTEEGWYWYEPELEAVEVLNVYEMDGQLYAMGLHVSEFQGLWFSEPLSVPGDK